jgi:hypothetical protein
MGRLPIGAVSGRKFLSRQQQRVSSPANRESFRGRRAMFDPSWNSTMTKIAEAQRLEFYRAELKKKGMTEEEIKRLTDPIECFLAKAKEEDDAIPQKTSSG